MGIYIIRAKDGPVKIGFTDQNPHVRISTLATSHWAKIELVAFFDGDKSVEKSLHKRFAASRIRGEWFRMSPELEEFISMHPTPPQKPIRKFEEFDPEYVEFLRGIWFDLSIESNNAAGKRAGVSYHFLAKHFGPSGREDRGRKAMRQAALDTAKKRTDDGRCNAERLFELWGGSDDIKQVSLKSGWPTSTIYRHFALQGITREMAALEMANRRKAKRASRKK